ncbi:MAG: restriction endonuclease subunit S [Planctomycetota bacterium]
MTPSSWKRLALGLAGDWFCGSTPSKANPDNWVGTIPWVSPKDMKRLRIADAEDHLSEAAATGAARVVPAGSILVVVRGMILAHSFPVARTTVPVAFNQDMRALVPGPDLDGDFVLLWLESQRDSVLKLVDVANHGTKRLPSEQFFALTLPVPPLAEQRKIAAILSSVDETIEKTEAVIAQLDVVKKAMLEELLTRGTRGRKLEPIAEEWRLGRLLPGITMKPEGWQLVRLVDIAKLESGHTPSRRHPEYWDGGVPWVSLHDTGALDGPEISETAQTVSDLGIANSSARLLPRGTVVFSRTATVGKATVLGREMSTSQDFANYVCGPRVHNRYLMHLLRFMQTEWARLMAGSTHQTIYMPVFRDLQILLPEVREQERIAEVADAVESRMQAERDSLVPLRAVKASLASELLSGATRVQPAGAT